MKDTDPSAKPSPDDLEELVAEALTRLEEGGDEALATFCDEHPRSSGSIRRAVELLRAQGMMATPDERTPIPEQLGPYRLLDTLGGGGMGVVYRARDETIGRDVALKLVRPDQLYFPGSRDRFQREVDTIANLRHAGIVPLYAVGEESGLPYYAMELVDGLTLAEVITALRDRRPDELTGADLKRVLMAEGHDDESASGSQLFSGSWETVCLRIVREIGETLEYAHRRGVIHRDVKPSNVMITPAGRVLLFDFGLSTQRGAARITRSGAPIGSFAYMAPEMLRGEAREDDGLLDVYSLGVTLFELLTLRLPFDASSEAQLLAAILRGESPRVDSFYGRASWEVETLFRVATDPDPRRRYAGPGAFARDVSNALAARPMEARRPGALLRTRRWVQRRPVAAAAVLAVVVGPTLFALQELRSARVIGDKNDEIVAKNTELQGALAAEAEAHRTATENYARAEANRSRAEASFAQAIDAVDRMLTRVGDETLQGIPHFERVRSALLQDALEFYDDLLARQENDDALRLETVRVAERAADLHAQVGNLAEGERILARALELLEPLHRDIPSAESGLLLANLYRRRAALARVRGDVAASRAWLARLEQLTSALPDAAAAGLRPMLANELDELASLDLELGRSAAARAGFKAVIEIREELVAATPSSTDLRYDLAVTLDKLASAVIEVDRSAANQSNRDDITLAVELGGRAIALAEALVEEDPISPRYRFRLARSLQNLCGAVSATGNIDGAAESGERAVELLEALVADFPAVPLYRRDLAFSYVTLAANCGMSGRLADSEDYSRRAIEVLLELGAASSGDVRMRGSLGVARFNLAGAYRSVGRRQEAEELLLAALEDFDAAIALAPAHALYHNYRQEVTNSLTVMVLNGEERLDEALDFVLAGIETAPSTEQLLIAVNFANDLLLRTDGHNTLTAEERAQLADRYGDLVGEFVQRAMASGAVSPDAVRREPIDRLWAEPSFLDAVGVER